MTRPLVSEELIALSWPWNGTHDIDRSHIVSQLPLTQRNANDAMFALEKSLAFLAGQDMSGRVTMGTLPESVTEYWTWFCRDVSDYIPYLSEAAWGDVRGFLRERFDPQERGVNWQNPPEEFVRELGEGWLTHVVASIMRQSADWIRDVVCVNTNFASVCTGMLDACARHVPRLGYIDGVDLVGTMELGVGVRAVPYLERIERDPDTPEKTREYAIEVRARLLAEDTGT